MWLGNCPPCPPFIEAPVILCNLLEPYLLTVLLSIPLTKLPYSKSSPKNLLPSIVESQTENYRELLPHLLLGVKIKEPLELQNLTVSFFHFLLFRTEVSVFEMAFAEFGKGQEISKANSPKMNEPICLILP